jgi:hypothetical protein
VAIAKLREFLEAAILRASHEGDSAPVLPINPRFLAFQKAARRRLCTKILGKSLKSVPRQPTLYVRGGRQ